MEKIGVSLHVGTLLNTPETEAQAALQKEYGGAAALLAYLRREGVCSIEVRNVRQEIKEKLKKAIKDGLSEDLEKDAENDLQKLHDKYIKQLEGLMDEKEKEIMTV